MPRIFDNIDRELLPALRASLEAGCRSDFCVGYFNLRGRRGIDDLIDRYSGAEGSLHLTGRRRWTSWVAHLASQRSGRMLPENRQYF